MAKGRKKYTLFLLMVLLLANTSIVALSNASQFSIYETSEEEAKAETECLEYIVKGERLVPIKSNTSPLTISIFCYAQRPVASFLSVLSLERRKYLLFRSIII